MQARNVWSPVYVNALVLRDQSSENNGVLDQRLYVVQDANWNVTALVDASGNVVERYAYDPYGGVTVLTPDWTMRGRSAYGWLYLGQGKRYDATVGLYHSRGARLSPTLGRPLQADPLGLVPDNNDYRWEGDGPTDRNDPSGLVRGWLSGAWDETTMVTSYVWSNPGSAAYEAATGANDGGRMFVNAATFHQIGSLNNRVNRDIAQNGGLYQAANVSMHVGAYSLEAAVALEAAGATSSSGAVLRPRAAGPPSLAAGPSLRAGGAE